jgi:predicted PhzF superfamily epimerase YddE/YHI9
MYLLTRRCRETSWRCPKGGSALSDDQMQRPARETNWSETVFLLPAEDGGDARIRIFTPPVSWHLPVIQAESNTTGSATTGRRAEVLRHGATNLRVPRILSMALTSGVALPAVRP